MVGGAKRKAGDSPSKKKPPTKRRVVVATKIVNKTSKGARNENDNQQQVKKDLAELKANLQQKDAIIQNLRDRVIRLNERIQETALHTVSSTAAAECEPMLEDATAESPPVLPVPPVPAP